MLSADEIAALFAAADPAPKKEEPVTEETEDAEPFTPTFTVVGKSAEAKEETEELTDNVTPITSTEPADDPNRQLSADEISALFAAADPAPKKEEPVATETPVTPAMMIRTVSYHQTRLQPCLPLPNQHQRAMRKHD